MTTTAISEATVITILSTSGRPTLITGSSIQMPIQIQSAIATIPVSVTSGSINVGSITLVVDVATVSDILAGTINSVQQVGTVSVLSSITATVSVQVIAGTVDVTVLGTPTVQVVGGTVDANILGTLTIQNSYVQTNILTNATVTTSGAATITAQALQSLVVDTVFGSVTVGSIQVSIVGVEPQSGTQTSVIIAGSVATVAAAQRLIAAGPLGAKVAIVWTTGAIATITGVSITAEQSTGE